MEFIFKQLNSNQHLFFDILPQDWREEIVPDWSQYKNSGKIYSIQENGRTIGGGIVFSTCPPDISYYKTEAQTWFDNGYQYLGFIWIAEDKRNMNLGSLWLEELKKLYPKQKYWLLIEEEHLHRFYQKNGFTLNKTIVHNNLPEWLYTYNPLSL